MKEIEKLAIGLFDKHALRNDGRVYDWNYLSRDRQIEWMKEVLVNVNFVLSEIRGKLKAPPAVLPSEPSYGVGFKNGMQVKHHEFTEMLNEIQVNLANQLAEISIEFYNNR